MHLSLQQTFPATTINTVLTHEAHLHYARSIFFTALSLCLFPNALRAADEPGLVGEYFAFKKDLSDFPKIGANRKPTFVRLDKTINFPDKIGEFSNTKLFDNFYVRWTGTLKTEHAGEHTFYLFSDDGSRLFIDGKLILDNGGTHPAIEKIATIDLKPGIHAIKLEYFQAGGGTA